MTTIGFKLAGLLFKQLVKPIAKSVKDQAHTRPWLRDICIKVGDWSNRVSLRLTLRLMGHNPAKIKPLAAEKALEYGANFLGEVLVFSSAALVTGAEFTRKYQSDANKAEAKREKERKQKEALENRFRTIETKIDILLERQNQHERFLEKVMGHIHSIKNESASKSWWKSLLGSISSLSLFGSSSTAS
mmetsp:Transcript_10960/g.15233  ORF Transcript_10960/g.15233 Transcript_10960/m.15233 type:complete len:188 (-) Transcript_10960:179-742(-)